MKYLTKTATIDSSERIARYYDQNTPRFLRYGGSGEAAAIHRQIWAPGVEDSAQAFLYLNRMVAKAIEPVLPGRASEARILDLGCGVGGTATWLAQTVGWSLTGVTNSAVQARLAAQRSRQSGLSDRCQFIEADFLNLPELGLFHAAYAIESFAHASDARRFFSQVAGRLHTGGRLVICDDFLSQSASSTQVTREAEKWIARFKQGWHINQLQPAGEVADLALSVGLGLVDQHDLTPYLRFFHPLLIGAINLVTWLPLRSNYLQNMRGGAALQVCVRRGWTQYQVMVWEKDGSKLNSKN